MNDFFQKNVFGEKLDDCSHEPLTGWYRDGCCNTDVTDVGLHTVCAKVNIKFLEFLKNNGNDLITPNPNLGFLGLKVDDCWCVCAASYALAIDAGVACPIYLKKTHERTLEIISLESLKKYAIDLN